MRVLSNTVKESLVLSEKCFHTKSTFHCVFSKAELTKNENVNVCGFSHILELSVMLGCIYKLIRNKFYIQTKVLNSRTCMTNKQYQY